MPLEYGVDCYYKYMTSSLSLSENYLSFFKDLLNFEFFPSRLSFFYLEFFSKTPNFEACVVD